MQLHGNVILSHANRFDQGEPVHCFECGAVIAPGEQNVYYACKHAYHAVCGMVLRKCKCASPIDDTCFYTFRWPTRDHHKMTRDEVLRALDCQMAMTLAQVENAQKRADEIDEACTAVGTSVEQPAWRGFNIKAAKRTSDMLMTMMWGLVCAEQTVFTMALCTYDHKNADFMVIIGTMLVVVGMLHIPIAVMKKPTLQGQGLHALIIAARLFTHSFFIGMFDDVARDDPMYRIDRGMLAANLSICTFTLWVAMSKMVADQVLISKETRLKID